MDTEIIKNEDGTVIERTVIETEINLDDIVQLIAGYQSVLNTLNEEISKLDGYTNLPSDVLEAVNEKKLTLMNERVTYEVQIEKLERYLNA